MTLSLRLAEIKNSSLAFFKIHTHFRGLKNVQKGFLSVCVSECLHLNICFSNGLDAG